VKWQRGYKSARVEDRRGRRVGLGIGGGLGLVLVVVIYLMGGDPSMITGGGGEPQAPPAEESELVSFVSFVFDDAQAVWEQRLGDRYAPASMVLFTGRTPTACGFGTAAVGPFYCPRDTKVYIDLSFYRQLKNRLGAPGDFAQAYVIAHEVGHHVQHQLGMLGRRDEGADGLSVRTELQADCLAGIWAHSTARRDLLERGDIEEGMGAAAAIGDDTLQKGAGGAVQPESWTHGSSAQRVRWFRRGYETGDLDACDTFDAAQL
jgi:uncharacterized protein